MDWTRAVAPSDLSEKYPEARTEPRGGTHVSHGFLCSLVRRSELTDELLVLVGDALEVGFQLALDHQQGLVLQRKQSVTKENCGEKNFHRTGLNFRVNTE